VIRTPVAAAAKQATAGCRVALFNSRHYAPARPCTICAKKGTVDGRLTAGQKRERACGADGGLTVAAGSLKAAAVGLACRVGCACVLNTWIRVRKWEQRLRLLPPLRATADACQ
jgi:hypothetical protein